MGGEVLQNFTAPNVGSSQILKKTVTMVIFVSVLLKDIFEQGKDFSWEPPSCCPRCEHHKVWSHGFVQRYFDGFDSFLWIKCYRCPLCGCILTLRPDTHFSRFQASKDTIRSSLEERIQTGRWPPSELSHSRQRHWMQNLKRKIKAILSDTWEAGVLAAYDYLLFLGHIPVSISI